MSKSHSHSGKKAGIIAGVLLAAGAWLAKLLGKATFKYRWQLTPLLIAAPMPVLGWILALTFWLWPAWTRGAFGVAGLCVAVWIWQGLERLYDRILAAVVAVLGLTWLYAVAVDPFVGQLYGALMLAWPVLGIFWWCGGTFRGRVFNDRMRKRWGRILEQAGAVGAKIIRYRGTDVGEQITIEMPGDSGDDLSKRRVAKARGGRRGSIHLAQDPNNERRVTIHTIDRDPWADGAMQPHPVLSVIDDLTAPNTDTEEAA